MCTEIKPVEIKFAMAFAYLFASCCGHSYFDRGSQVEVIQFKYQFITLPDGLLNLGLSEDTKH